MAAKKKSSGKTREKKIPDKQSNQDCKMMWVTKAEMRKREKAKERKRKSREKAEEKKKGCKTTTGNSSKLAEEIMMLDK